MINNLVNNSQLCGCKRPPRVIIENYAICACEHLIYTSSRGIGPMTPWDSWTATIHPAGRQELITRAKQRIGHVPAADPDAVRDAVSAARAARSDNLANDLEYEQWVASL